MFKKLILIALMFISIQAYSQTNTQSVLAKTTSNKLQWDLNKYCWSHTHFQSGKNNKPVIDFDAIENVTNIGDEINISNDGKYASYSVFSSTKGSKRVIVQSTNNDWKREFRGISMGFFSRDGKQYIYQDKNTLCFLELGQDKIQTEKEIVSIKQDADGKNEWAAFQLKEPSNKVILENLLTGKQKSFSQVRSYQFEKGNWFSCLLENEGKELVLYNFITEEEKKYQSVNRYLMDETGSVVILQSGMELKYVNQGNGVRSSIWSGGGQASISNFSIDSKGKQVLFVLKNGERNELWYWQLGMDKALKKADEHTDGIEGMEIQSASFSENGNYLKLEVSKNIKNLVPEKDAILLDTWSYKDSMIQSLQASQIKKTRTYKAILNLSSARLIYCEQDYEYITVRGNVGLIERNGKPNERESGDRFWEKDYDRRSCRIISLKDGSILKKLETNSLGGGFQFSPDGRYLVYFDYEQGCNIFSIDLYTGKVANISVSVPAAQLGYEDIYQRPHEKPAFPVDPAYLVGTWLVEEEAILVHDNYDIWQLDLAGKKPAVNITNGYGRRHHIILKLAGKNREPVFFPGTKELLIKAFNRDTKYNGYYKKSLGAAGDPELLYMGPCFITGQIWITGLGMEPLKAQGANVWVVRRETDREAPNYFLTTDFKNYKPVTDLQPQQQYNWYTTELHNFKQLDGTMTQGILYKPENFDPTKKYPVIINFYSQLSQNLYRYWKPGYINAPHLFANPAWMVSHGYLVFLPDIYFTKNQYGPSTVNTVEGAAKYLSTLHFVNAKHIGAVGHSNSGRFGYYLFTHSHLFAAMAIGAGVTDPLSVGLSVDKDDGTSNLFWAERRAFGTALGNLWQNKASWLDHSAVLNADKASSPLLLFHNKDDGAFKGGEGLAMYIALRRLEKKVWWLQYDEGRHVVIKESDARDYTIRFTQYFDHYLKGAPAPKWMTEGIPAKLKSIDAKYELDPGGSCALENSEVPPSGRNDKICCICEAWNKQYKRTSEMFSREISEWKLDKDIEAEMNKQETERYKRNMVGEAQRIKENNAKLKQSVKK